MYTRGGWAILYSRFIFISAQPYIPTQKEINEVAADLPDPNPEIPEGMVMDRILVFGPEGFVKFIDMDPYVPDQPSDGPSGTAQCTVSGSSQ